MEIYSVMKQKFEEYAEEQIAVALRVVQVCDLSVVSEADISDLYVK
jgi:hypothetical protein